MEPDTELPMSCPVCGIADVAETSAGGWRCRQCGSSDKRLNL